MVKADTNGNTEDENLRKIFVGGLSSNTTEESLKAFYETFGEVTDVVVMKDAQTQRTRGFGFVTFGAQTHVDEAMKNRPHEIDGKKVDPKRAVPKDDTNRGQSQISTQRLFVSGIKDTHTEDQLKEHFSQYGNVTKVDIPKDKTTDKMRGFAFITFDDYDPVDRCVLDKEHTIGDQKCQLKKGLTKDEMGKAQMGRDRMIRGDRSRGGGGRGAMGGGGGRGGFGRGGGQQAGWGQQAWGQQQGWDQYNQGGQWGGYGGGAQGQWGAAQQGGQYGQQAGWGRGY